MTTPNQLLNFVNGQWTRSSASEALTIINPATAEALTTVPLSPGAEVDAAVLAGQKAFKDWSETPAVALRLPPTRLPIAACVVLVAPALLGIAVWMFSTDCWNVTQLTRRAVCPGSCCAAQTKKLRCA